jgi:transcriptional antiterminator RfaH
VYWACAQLEPHRERLALHCLEHVAGFTVYCPRLRERKTRFPGAQVSLRPLFPGYTFVLIALQWHSARWAPGVVRLVLDGAVPARVPDMVIDELRARERNGVIVLPERTLRRGDAVRVTRGPFRDQLALFAGMRPRERIEVLLSLFGQQSRIVLARADVEPT